MARHALEGAVEAPGAQPRWRRDGWLMRRCFAAFAVSCLLVLVVADAFGPGERSVPRAGVEAGAAAEGASGPPGKAVGSPVAGIGARVERARRWAKARPGRVSFAVVGRDGRVRGYAEHARYPAASTVKAMLLAAETRRLAAAGDGLDPATRELLDAMITISDNDAATSIHARVGDEGLRGVAARAGMEDFRVAASWGSARISAADLALLYSDLDSAFPRRFADYAEGLLGSIAPEQSWGLPRVAPPEFAVRFKGGWRPEAGGELVHQGAELRRGDQKLAVAILTAEQPSMESGIETIEGIGERLLGG